MAHDNDPADRDDIEKAQAPQAASHLVSMHVAAAAGGLRRGPLGSGELRRCSFCGRRDRSVGHLVRSRAAIICDLCANQIVALLADTATDQRNIRFKPLLSAPADRVAAERDIEAAYERLFDGTAPPEQRASAIEDGENLAESILETGRRAPAQGGVDVFIDYIRFIAEDEAEVRFTLTLDGPGIPQLNETGFAVLTDTGWRVARATWCGLASRVGVHCPPPPPATVRS
jgi:hypothetical protein